MDLDRWELGETVERLGPGDVGRWLVTVHAGRGSVTSAARAASRWA
jgi:RimJ/RimL family protein N-acetyltransferase